MKQFEFSLGKVLDFKNQMLDREKNELSQLRRAKDELERRYQQAEYSFQLINEEMAEETCKGITIVELRSYQYQLDSLREEQRELEERIRLQDEMIADQLEVVLGMSQDVSGLDKLKEHQKEEYNLSQAKEAESEIAEFISGKLVRQAEA